MTKKSKIKKKGNNPDGRDSYLTPKFINGFVALVQRGNYFSTVCQCMRIHLSTYRRWMNEGEQVAKKCPHSKNCIQFMDKEERKKIDFKCPPRCEFFNKVEEAKGFSEIRVVEKWQAQLDNNWQACKDFLARRYPKRWANREYNINKDADKINVKQLTDKELEDIIADKVPGGMGATSATEGEETEE